MLRVPNAFIAPYLVALLPACSLAIDTNPDGLITSGAAGKLGTSSTRIAGGGTGHAAGASNAGAATSPFGTSSAGAGAAPTSGGWGGASTGDTTGLGAAPSTGGVTMTIGGATATGGTTTTGPCTDEGCACAGTATIPCNDCGTRACDTSTQRWGACSASQSPPATQCANAATLQTCGGDGKWINTTCANPDATHCFASCVIEATSSVCRVSANDTDTDGHSAKACTAAPGDDCDDNNKNVYPGAVEACDGVDNDCNGKSDLKDGWALSGTTVSESRYVGDLEWWPTQRKFAVVSAGSELYFGTMARTAGTAHATEWNSSASLAESGYALSGKRIVWVPARETFVLGYEKTAMSSAGYFRDMDGQGVVSEQRDPPYGFESMATRSVGDVLVVSSGNTYVYVTQYTGAPLGAPITVTNDVFPFNARIATSSDQSAVIFTQPDNLIKWFRITASLEAELPTKLSDAGESPDIASVSNGYAVAWGTAVGLDYQVMRPSDRSIVCGPTHVASASIGALEIASTGYGTLVLTQSTGGVVRLFRFDASCNLVDDVLVDNNAATATYSRGLPHIAAGDGVVALAWGDGSGAFSKTRIIGERLCN